MTSIWLALLMAWNAYALWGRGEIINSAVCSIMTGVALVLARRHRQERR